MPVGIIINALSVASGGVVGALFGHKLPTRINSELTKIFGVCSMGMGVSSIGLMKNMPAVIFAVIIGTAFGLAINLGGIITKGAGGMEKPVGKIFPNKNKDMSREEYMTMLVTIIVLFCASGTGIYGSLDSGMSGDHTILISKSILDFFTAMIFGGTLGMVVAAVAIPQCVIFLAIFAAAKFIFPLTTPDMIADFKACGGFLLLATGFRIAKIHNFPVADMIPAMVLVMPVSWFWGNVATFFSVRAKAFDAEFCCAGKDAVKRKIREIENNKDATAVEQSMMTTLEVCYEFYLRGFHFDTINIYESDATKFKVTENGLLPPFTTVHGLGEAAAIDTVEKRNGKEFVSVEEFAMCCKHWNSCGAVCWESCSLPHL